MGVKPRASLSTAAIARSIGTSRGSVSDTFSGTTPQPDSATIMNASRHDAQTWLNASIHVALVALRLLQAVDVFLRLLGRLAAVDFSDLVQCEVDIRGHLVLVAADEEVCAFLKPRPDLRAALFHAMLHVNLSFLIA